ncbi:TRAP transporter small permease [Roseovarius sp.]|uniref:TRAP transporter small permease n=1 Tax=Roseovarius sp. TaxID=1486281 RepID=UPI003A96EC3D
MTARLTARSFLTALENSVLAAMVLVALGLITWDVVIRYFFPTHLAGWTTEVVIYLVVSAMLLSGWSLVRLNQHVRAELIVELLGPKARYWVELGVTATGLTYCAIVAWFAVDMAQFARMLDIRSASSLHFPVWIFYLAVPVGFALMGLGYAVRLIHLARIPEDRIADAIQSAH